MAKSDEHRRIENEIRHLELIRDDLTRHISKLKQYQRRLIGVGEATHDQWVMRSDVESRTRIWLDLYERQHGHAGRTLLCEMAHISHATLKNILGETEQGKQQRIVRLDIADRLFQAINMTHALHEIDILNGTVRQVSANLPEPPFSHYEED